MPSKCFLVFFYKPSLYPLNYILLLYPSPTPPEQWNIILYLFVCFCNSLSAWNNVLHIIDVQLLSPVWLCDPMDCSTPGTSVLHYYPEFAQIHAHWVSDAIQPSHPLSSSSPPAFNLFQHQGLFQWVGSWHQVAKALELQHQSFQWIFGVDFLQDWLVWSLCSPWDSQESSPESSILWHLDFFMVQLSHPYMTTGKIPALTRWTFVGKVMSLLFNMLPGFFHRLFFKKKVYYMTLFLTK